MVHGPLSHLWSEGGEMELYFEMGTHTHPKSLAIGVSLFHEVREQSTKPNQSQQHVRQDQRISAALTHPATSNQRDTSRAMDVNWDKT